ncbi:uncharacterized protein LOC106646636 [Copidosoma floridanum]|uniref:uncharacterized protein LOC106646636 n=1 Tax=Copidosoma floridanum TaxID=29053 RepID=UPI0006C9933C|nr:uncharacterized protein LOC106646636 [Copidosoma floridanum]
MKKNSMSTWIHPGIQQLTSNTYLNQKTWRFSIGTYKCSARKYHSTFKTNVKRHVRNVHGDHNSCTHFCDYCDFSSKYKSCVKRLFITKLFNRRMFKRTLF